LIDIERKKILILIPTYNESENVSKMYRTIINLNLNAAMLFIDDNSPDGTGEILESFGQQDENVFIIHRERRQGVGSAHLLGIKYAYTKGYDILITMDCDFTHEPKYILDFLQNSVGFDLVVGSRFTMKDSLSEWSILRKFLTFLGHLATRIFLNIPYDATGAFRLYKLRNIPPAIFDIIKSTSYSFFIESLYGLYLNGIKIKEIPIYLPKRTYGHSKMRISDIFYSIYMLIKIRFLSKRYIINRQK